MILTTVLLTVLCFQFLVFNLISFPFLAIQAERKIGKPSTLLTGKSDIPIIPCNVTVDCGSCKNVTEDGGIIESQNFPDEYSSSLNCLFTINAPPEKKINLTFTEFSVKECCDFVTVFDGFANPLQVSLNGYDNPPADVISPANQMAIKFTTNAGENIAEYNASKSRPVTRWQATFTFI